MVLPRNKGMIASVFLGLAALFTGSVRSQDASPGNGAATDFTVVLDAGHGGHDPGNLGNGFLEKDIALKIVLEVGRNLAAVPQVKVVYTRNDDTFVDLFKRGEIANKAKADLFVSVHCDSHNSDAHGAGTFVLGLHANKQNFEIAKKENSVIYLEDDYETRYAGYDINSPESVIGLTIMQEEFLDQSIHLGKLVQDRFTGQLGRTDRKVKQAGFIVLHQTFMPSVLIETGFLTNKDEGSYLNSRKGQQEMGKAIADAILEYRNSVRTGGDEAITRSAPAEKKEDIKAGGQPDPAPAQGAVAAGAKPDAENGKPANQPAVSQPEPTQADKAPQTGAADSGQPKQEVAADPVKAEAPAILFKVQLVAVSREPSLNPDDFNGLPNLSVERYQKVYRVLYGNTPSYEEAQRLQSFAALRGYPQAYIVAYRNGERIPLPEALSALPQ